MAGAEAPRHLGGERRFVARRAGEDVEAERERGRRVGQVAAGEGGDESGIEAGREEDSDRHVGDEMGCHRLLDRLDGCDRLDSLGPGRRGRGSERQAGTFRRSAGKRAGKGGEAIETVMKLRPDLVLMDVNMPYLDGLTLTWFFARRFPVAKIVLMSTDNTPELLEACEESGAFDFVHKENFRQEFSSVIQRLNCHQA